MSVRRCASGRAHYNYYRDLDTATGRYSESDPIGLSGGVNTFAYALSNPLRGVDPFGLQSSEGDAPKPTYPSGAGEKGEAACDSADDMAEAGRRAADAKAKGDGGEYCKQKRKEYDAMIRYYAAMGVSIPKDPPPCFPFPPPPPKAPRQDSTPPAASPLLPSLDIPTPTLSPPELPK